MSKLFKILSIFFLFFASFVLLDETTPNVESTTKFKNLEYYKTLARAGFFKKSKQSKFIASIKRLDVKTDYAEHHVCTGAIISESSILTLAECTYDGNHPLAPHKLTVVVGIQYGSMYDQFTQTIAVNSIRRHENYEAEDDNNDEYNIAVLMLNDTIVTIGDTVDIAPIATKPPKNYESCIGIGFGVLFYQDIQLSQILEGELKVWPMGLCESYLKRHKKSEKMSFCAGDMRELKLAPCKLMASEPLYCHDVLYGVSVFSIGCESHRGIASVYLSVWEHRTWIKQNVELLRDKATLPIFNVFWLAVAILLTLFFG